MPQVSVVLPVFNAQATIERAARSILGQTLRDLELIIIDDGSTDETPSIVGRIVDRRVRIMRCPHQGVVAAANLGTRLSVAPFIARMDADDFSHPERLAHQLQLASEQRLDVVGCQVHVVTNSRNTAPSWLRYERWINEETLRGLDILGLRFVEFPLVNPTILARRGYFELGFRDDGLPEDYDLMLRAAENGWRFGKVARVLLDWTDRPDRLTRSDSRYSENAFMTCRRKYLLRGPLRDVPCVDLWGVGRTGKPWLRWLQSLDVRVRHAYDMSPRKQGKHIHGVAVEHPSCLRQADGTPLLIAVGAKNARQVIRPQVQRQGYRVGADVWFVA